MSGIHLVYPASLPRTGQSLGYRKLASLEISSICKFRKNLL